MLGALKQSSRQHNAQPQHSLCFAEQDYMLTIRMDVIEGLPLMWQTNQATTHKHTRDQYSFISHTITAQPRACERLQTPSYLAVLCARTNITMSFHVPPPLRDTPGRYATLPTPAQECVGPNSTSWKQYAHVKTARR